MTRLEATTLLQARLGSRSGLATQIVSEIKLKQASLENDASLSPWFLKDRLDTSLGAVGNSVVLASTFLRLQEGGRVVLYQDPVSSGWKEVMVIATSRLDYLPTVAESGGSTKGSPNVAYLDMDGGTPMLLFDPYPDATYALRINSYVRAPTLSTDGTENSWLIHAPELLIAETGLEMAKYLRDPAIVEVFSTAVRDARRNLMVASVANVLAGAADLELGTNL